MLCSAKATNQGRGLWGFMDYLSDSIDVEFNGAKRRMGLAVSNGHLIAFFRKSGFFDDLAAGLGGLAGVALVGAILPVAAVGLLALSLAEDNKRESFEVDLNNIKAKFRLTDELILISNQKSSRVTIGKGGFLMMDTTVKIDGDFSIGDSVEKTTIKVYPISTSISAIRKIFEKNGYVPSVA